MKTRSLLPLSALLILATSSSAVRAQLIGFEDLPTPPGTTAHTGLQFTNNDSLNYGDVIWDSRIDVVGKDYGISGDGPLYSGGATNGGNYYITNDTSSTQDPDTTAGNGITLTTTKVLLGADFGAVEYYGYSEGEGASQVTIEAMGGSTILDSLTFDLAINTETSGPSNTSQPMTYFDTSEFANLKGITGYVINRTPYNPDNLQYGEANWVADNFVFTNPIAVPEPGSGKLAILMGLALGGALAVRRLRVKAA